jgi:MoaA/NifB/PqqE/SkfB family radical SAM enzyme
MQVANEHVQSIDGKKMFKSDTYNWIMDEKTGFFVRWGVNKKDDPLFSPYGPEICDMEISTVCSGPYGKPCRECYKTNTSVGTNMSFETFKQIFHKLPLTVSQIAFGIGDVSANEDLFRIMRYCRENDYNPNVAPNITINGKATAEEFDQFAELCGAIAVSNYGDICYDAIQELTNRGMKQVNIHQILSVEKLAQCHKTIDDATTDPRLVKLNAIVFLLLKPKGERNTQTPLRDTEEWRKLVEHAQEKKVAIGFDSCSSPWYLSSGAATPMDMYCIEPCESFGMFSSYINVDGKYFPCSFCEKAHDDFIDGIDVVNCNDFLVDVWYSGVIVKWRNKMIARKLTGNFHCPIYDI